MGDLGVGDDLVMSSSSTKPSALNSPNPQLQGGGAFEGAEASGAEQLSSSEALLSSEVLDSEELRSTGGQGSSAEGAESRGAEDRAAESSETNKSGSQESMQKLFDQIQGEERKMSVESSGHQMAHMSSSMSVDRLIKSMEDQAGSKYQSNVSMDNLISQIEEETGKGNRVPSHAPQGSREAGDAADSASQKTGEAMVTTVADSPSGSADQHSEIPPHALNGIKDVQAEPHPVSEAERLRSSDGARDSDVQGDGARSRTVFGGTEFTVGAAGGVEAEAPSVLKLRQSSTPIAAEPRSENDSISSSRNSPSPFGRGLSVRGSRAVTPDKEKDVEPKLEKMASDVKLAWRQQQIEEAETKGKLPAGGIARTDSGQGNAFFNVVKLMRARSGNNGDKASDPVSPSIEIPRTNSNPQAENADDEARRALVRRQTAARLQRVLAKVAKKKTGKESPPISSLLEAGSPLAVGRTDKSDADVMLGENQEESTRRGRRRRSSTESSGTIMSALFGGQSRAASRDAHSEISSTEGDARSEAMPGSVRSGRRSSILPGDSGQSVRGLSPRRAMTMRSNSPTRKADLSDSGRKMSFGLFSSLGSTGNSSPSRTMDRAATMGRRRSSLGGTISAMAKSRIKLKKWKQAAQDILGKLPPWLTPELLTATTHRLRTLKTEDRLSMLRGQNAVMQTEQDTWKILISALSAGAKADKEAEPRLIEALSDRRLKYYETFGEGAEVASMLVSGPVGDVPLHQCFLLGMFDLGKKIVEAYYDTEELMNTPYGSDLKVWMDSSVIRPEDDDGGLYTGQTIFHIAVINGPLSLNRWLLNRGANITARATGTFFKPKWLRQKQQGEVAVVGTRGRMRQFVGHHWRRLKLFFQGETFESKYDVSWRENPNSACYYGEFPLSFAASVGRADVCELILTAFKVRRQAQDKRLADLFESMCELENAHGEELRLQKLNRGPNDKHPAFWDELPLDYMVNAQDSEGNTALHMAVLHSRKDVIGWLLDNGGLRSLEITNLDGFTPLTLAVRLGNVKIFHFLLQNTRFVVWVFGHVQMTKTALDQIDTFRIRNHPLHPLRKWQSCLEIITMYEVEEFAEDDMYVQLVTEKWEKFARYRYFVQFMLPYMILITSASAVLYLRCFVKKSEWNLYNNGEFDEQLGWGTLEWMRRMWVSPPTPSALESRMRISASVLEIFIAVAGLPILVREGWAARRLKKEDIDPHGEGRISLPMVMRFLYKNLLFLLSIGIAFSGIIAVVSGLVHRAPWDKIELQALAIMNMFLWSGFLVVVMPFKFFGVLVITMWTMLTDDIFKFLVTYLVLVAAFSQAIYALSQMAHAEDRILRLDEGPGNAFVKLIWVSLSDTRNILEVLVETTEPGLTLAVYMIYIVLSMVLMLNLLIAMMNKTFSEYMQNSHNTWIYPFAHLVLRIERSMPYHLKLQHRSGRSSETPVADSAKHTSGSRKAPDEEIHYNIQVTENEAASKRTKIQQQHEKEEFLLEAVKEGLLDPFKSCCKNLSDLSRTVREINKGTQREKESSRGPMSMDHSPRTEMSGSAIGAMGWKGFKDRQTSDILPIEEVNEFSNSSASLFGQSRKHVSGTTSKVNVFQSSLKRLAGPSSPSADAKPTESLSSDLSLPLSADEPEAIAQQPATVSEPQSQELQAPAASASEPPIDDPIAPPPEAAAGAKGAEQAAGQEAEGIEPLEIADSNAS